MPSRLLRTAIQFSNGLECEIRLKWTWQLLRRVLKSLHFLRPASLPAHPARPACPPMDQNLVQDLVQDLAQDIFFDQNHRI